MGLAKINTYNLINCLLIFAKNFFKPYKTSISNKVNFTELKNCVFFSKGVSILYAKNNLKLLNKIIKLSNCGSFDI